MNSLIALGIFLLGIIMGYSIAWLTYKDKEEKAKRINLLSIQETDYKQAWLTLYNCFGERMQQGEIELMDIVMQSVKLDKEDFG